MVQFTPISALAGGVLIGLAASLLLAGNGRVAGISSIVGGLLVPTRGESLWRGAFIAGLIAVGAAAAYFAPRTIGSSPRSVGWLIIAGLLVGAGTRLSGGCTSGHGVCGISRLSPRSLVATITFIAIGMLIVRVCAWLAGAA